MRRLPPASLALAVAVSVGSFVPIASSAQAQQALPTCQPPATGEYLLLTVIPNADAQTRVYAILPPSFKPNPCNYLGETVVRIGGFATQEAADTWASYIFQQAGTPAFVARPPAPGQPSVLPPIPAPPNNPPQTPPFPGSSPIPQPIPQPAPQPNPTLTPVPTIVGYDPQPLGNGYAVLVNYYNRPETANQVKEVTSQSIGLVSYGQRPYLLATFTTDQAAANNLLQRLTDKGLWAMVVDGRRVMLVKAGVR